MGLWCLFAHGSRTAFRHWRVLHFWPRGLMDKASDFGSGDWALSRPVVVFFILFAVFSSFFAFLFLFLFLFFVCCEKRSPLSRRSFLRILSHSSTLFLFLRRRPHTRLFSGEGGRRLSENKRKREGLCKVTERARRRRKSKQAPRSGGGSGPRGRPPPAAAARGSSQNRQSLGIPELSRIYIPLV